MFEICDGVFTSVGMGICYIFFLSLLICIVRGESIDVAFQDTASRHAWLHKSLDTHQHTERTHWHPTVYEDTKVLGVNTLPQEDVIVVVDPMVCKDCGSRSYGVTSSD